MPDKDIFILGIESSCDETAASVVKNGRTVLSNEISSQIDIHTLYGGVVPEIASRKHTERINQVIRKALADAGKSLTDMDAIAVTYGPGLVGPLLIGVSANYIAAPELEPPFVCIIVSGGHTHLVLVEGYGKYRILGMTQDDAAGEAFDKVARAVGLGYPGGPKIDKAARDGDPTAIRFPRGKVGDSVYDFSFSGLKSAVLNYLNEKEMKHEIVNVPDLAASFQQSVVDVLVTHAVQAASEYHFKKLALAGGVASNSSLRAQMKEACEKRGIEFFCPPPILCTDNAAMIACAGYYEYRAGSFAGLDLNAVPGLRLGER